MRIFKKSLFNINAITDAEKILRQAYEWKSNNIIITEFYDPEFIYFLLNGGNNLTKFIIKKNKPNKLFKKRNKTLKEKILLFSGGMDSLIAWFYLNNPPVLFVDLKYFYSWKEKLAAEYIKEKTSMEFISVEFTIMDAYKKGWGDTIPARNLLLVSIGSYFSNVVYLISQKGEFFIPDRSPRFFQEVTKALSIFYGTDLIITSPFLNMTKGEMVKWYIRKGYDANLLKKTIGCFNPEPGHCGCCPCCFRKWIALEYAGIQCLDLFNRDIRNWEGIKKYIERFIKGYYDSQRTEETFEVLKKYGLV